MIYLSRVYVVTYIDLYENYCIDSVYKNEDEAEERVKELESTYEICYVECYEVI